MAFEITDAALDTLGDRDGDTSLLGRLNSPAFDSPDRIVGVDFETPEGRVFGQNFFISGYDRMDDAQRAEALKTAVERTYSPDEVERLKFASDFEEPRVSKATNAEIELQRVQPTIGSDGQTDQETREAFNRKAQDSQRDKSPRSAGAPKTDEPVGDPNNADLVNEQTGTNTADPERLTKENENENNNAREKEERRLADEKARNDELTPESRKALAEYKVARRKGKTVPRPKLETVGEQTARLRSETYAASEAGKDRLTNRTLATPKAKTPGVKSKVASVAGKLPAGQMATVMRFLGPIGYSLLAYDLATRGRGRDREREERGRELTSRRMDNFRQNSIQNQGKMSGYYKGLDVLGNRQYSPAKPDYSNLSPELEALISSRRQRLGQIAQSTSPTYAESLARNGIY